MHEKNKVFLSINIWRIISLRNCTIRDVGTQTELITTMAELKRRRRQFQSLNPEDFNSP